MKIFDVLTNTDIKRIKEEHGKLALTRRIEELDKSLSIALEINDNYQRENVALKEEIEKLKAYLARAKEDHQYDNLVHQKELKDFRKGRWDANFKPLDGSKK